MIIKRSENTIPTQPFATTLLKGIPLIILIFINTGNVYGKTTTIKLYGIDLLAESLPKTIFYPFLLKTKIIKIKKPIIFYLIFSKNLYFKYKGNVITIKLFSRGISYRASYNYKRKNLATHCIYVDDLKITELLELTHEHVYDLLSISYASKKYKINKAAVECYHNISIGFSINFPGEFYEEYIWIPPLNVKSIRDLFTPFHNVITVPHTEKETYEYYFVKKNRSLDYNEIKDFYSVIFSSTNISQWIINVAIGLIENIFLEYAIEMPICTFLTFYPLYVHISLGTIIGTIECLYKHIKDDNKNIKNDYDRGFLKSFFFLFLQNSIAVFKIGYYN